MSKTNASSFIGDSSIHRIGSDKTKQRVLEFEGGLSIGEVYSGSTHNRIVIAQETPIPKSYAINSEISIRKWVGWRQNANDPSLAKYCCVRDLLNRKWKNSSLAWARVKPDKKNCSNLVRLLFSMLEARLKARFIKAWGNFVTLKINKYPVSKSQRV